MILTKSEFNSQFYKLENILLAFAYSLTKNSDDAKDLFQETACRALSNREKFAVGTNLKAWLFTIMKNIFINNYRRKAKANTILDNTNNSYYINSSKSTSVNAGDGNILMQEITALINRLDESVRQPFLMHYKGYKYQEIADRLGLPLGTVKSRIFFARKDLKHSIQRIY